MLHAVILVTLLVAGFTCGILGRHIHSSWLVGFGAFQIGTAVALNVYSQIREGEASSNWGTFRQEQHPFGYWASVLFPAFFAVMFIMGGLLAMLGWIPVSGTE